LLRHATLEVPANVAVASVSAPAGIPRFPELKQVDYRLRVRAMTPEPARAQLLRWNIGTNFVEVPLILVRSNLAATMSSNSAAGNRPVRRSSNSPGSGN
jgi:hypothetical protein